MTRTAFFTAHPDDHEMMLAYHTLQDPSDVYAFVATDGRASTIGDPAFVAQGLRRQESVRGLEYLGITPQHQYHAGLDDGQLSQATEFSRLLAAVRDFIDRHDITTAVTLGRDGGDYHPDHIAVHQAVIQVGRETTLTIWGINAHSQGPRRLTPDPEHAQRKLTALAHHASQFPPRTLTTERLRPYHHFLEAETYDRYSKDTL